jgi:hypothetical protein
MALVEHHDRMHACLACPFIPLGAKCTGIRVRDSVRQSGVSVSLCVKVYPVFSRVSQRCFHGQVIVKSRELRLRRASNRRIC